MAVPVSKMVGTPSPAASIWAICSATSAVNWASRSSGMGLPSICMRSL